MFAINFYFNSFSSLPPGGLTGCVALTNYLCSNAFLSNATGNLTIQLGQNTGLNWSNVYFIFIPTGTPINSSGVPILSFNKLDAAYNSSLPTGSELIDTLPATAPGIKKGTRINGYIWAKYSTDNQSIHYVEVAVLNVKAD